MGASWRTVSPDTRMRVMLGAMVWWERWAFNALHVVVAATGFAYLYMKLALVPEDPFALVNHPWQPAMIATHLIAAPFIAFFAAVSLLRVAASFLVPVRTHAGPTFVMAAGAVILMVDLGRAFVGGPAPAVRIAPPFTGEWLVVQGGRSPLQNHHRVGAPARPDPRASREGLGRSSRAPRPPGGRGPAEAASRSGRHERGEHR